MTLGLFHDDPRTYVSFIYVGGWTSKILDKLVCGSRWSFCTSKVDTLLNVPPWDKYFLKLIIKMNAEDNSVSMYFFN